MPQKKQILFSEIKRVFVTKRLRWIFAFLAIQAIPFLEIAFISCVYLVLDPKKCESFLSKICSFSLFNFDLSKLSRLGATSSVFIAGLVLLLLTISLRYANEINMIRLKYFFYVRDSQRLISNYLYSSATLAHRIGKEKITDCIIHDCGILADNTQMSLVIFGAVCSVLLYLIGGVLLSWKILLVALMLYALPLWITRHVYSKMQDIGELKVRTHERVLRYFTDILDGHKRSKLDSLESPLEAKSVKILKKSQNWRIQKRKTQARFLVTMDGLALLSLLIVLYISISFLNVKLSILMIIFVIFNRMKGYITTITNSTILIRERLPNVYRYIELLNLITVKEPIIHEVTVDSKDAFSRIEAKGISFKYDRELILNDINFEASAGDRILIQGPSGQGKSTFLEILCGLLPPSEGTVLYDGKPLDNELFYKIRPYIAYASPTVYLFQDTLKVNLTMGVPIEAETLNKALKLSKLDEVITELPDGLNSYIGTDGDALSLGQRQRVILARLYLKNPRLILLDEATANLDPKMESEIISNLLSFLDPSAILVMVAHKEPKGLNFNKKFNIIGGRLQRGAV